MAKRNCQDERRAKLAIDKKTLPVKERERVEVKARAGAGGCAGGGGRVFAV